MPSHVPHIKVKLDFRAEGDKGLCGLSILLEGEDWVLVSGSIKGHKRLTELNESRLGSVSGSLSLLDG